MLTPLFVPQWDDLRVPGLSMRAGASAPDLVNVSGGLYLLAFDGNNTVEETHFSIQIPHSYKEGTDLLPHIHWSPLDAAAGAVRWSLEYSWANVGDVLPASTTIHVVQNSDQIALKHQVASLAAITGTGKKISSMIMCRLFRDPTNIADTYGSDAGLLEFDFHYEMDSSGSYVVNTKR